MSKDLYFENQQELLYRVEMPYRLYKKIKDDEAFEEIKLLGVKDPSINFSSNKDWKDSNDKLIESIKKRKGIEEQIRAELLSKEGNK